ncbi:hypothetical protein BH10BAC5_BH10BAC5_27790 [soil metagenome]
MGNSSTITQKGQVVIPSEIRKKLNLKKGTRVTFQIEKLGILLQPVTDEYIDSLIGIANTQGKALKSLFKDKKIEKEL